MKRGISPLIATVLLIGFVIVLAVIVLQWGAGFFQGMTEETGEEVDFEMKTSYLDFNLLDVTESFDKIHFMIENDNEMDFKGFTVVVEGSKGSETVEVDEGVPGFNTKKVSATYNLESIGVVKNIKIYPKVLYEGESKVVSSLEKEFGELSGKKIEEEVEDDLVLWLNFDDGTAKDSSSYGNDFSSFGTPEFNQEGISGYAVELDGNEEMSEYLDYGNKDPFKITGSLSVESWVYQNEGKDMTLISNFLNNNGYILDIYNTDRARFRFNNVAPLGSSSGSIVENKWIHVVGVYSLLNKQMHIFIDGDLDNTKPNVDQPNSVDYSLKVGAKSPTPGNANHFNGKLDEIRIYNRALSPEEVKARYNRFF